MFDPTLFERGSDFRGEYPRQINEELAWLVGRYLVQFLWGKGRPRARVLVGRDGRCSSPALYAALVQGIAAEGGAPIPAGLATSDMILWGTGEGLEGAVAGVMVTASHNPPRDNGIKIILRGKGTVETVSPKSDLREIYQADCQGEASVAADAGSVAPFPLSARLDLAGKFVRHACERAPDRFDFDQTVVLDPGNGVGSLFVDPLKQCLTRSGEKKPKAKLELIFADIDGTFPNRPSNPGLPGAVKALENEVREKGAAFGAAFDGDADRVFLVDELGDFVPGDRLLAALARIILSGASAGKRRDPPVVFVTTCSWLLVDILRQAGADPVLCKVGQGSVKKAMQLTRAVFGGEASAHFNFPDSYYQDSGLIALMTFWQALHTRKTTVSQVIGELEADRWAQSGEINIKIHSDDWSDISKKTIEKLQGVYAAKPCYVLDIDGINVYFPYEEKIKTVDKLFPQRPDNPSGEPFRAIHKTYRPQWWFSLRRSNNEPLLRLNVESRDTGEMERQTRELLEEVTSTCEGIRKCETEVVDWGNLDWG